MPHNLCGAESPLDVCLVDVRHRECPNHCTATLLMAGFLFKHVLGRAARPRRPFDAFGANGVLPEFVTLKSAKRLKVAPLPVVVERSWMLGVDQSPIFLTHEFLHYRIHIVDTFIDENFRVLFVGRFHANISVVNMVYHVLAFEIASDLYRVLAHLACHAAVKGDSVAGPRHNVYSLCLRFQFPCTSPSFDE